MRRYEEKDAQKAAKKEEKKKEIDAEVENGQKHQNGFGKHVPQP